MKVLNSDVDFWKEVVENSLTAIFIIDENLRYEYVNKIVEKVTGYKKNEFCTMDNIFELTYPDDIDHVTNAVERAIRGEKVFVEHRYVTKNGDIRWAWGFIAPVEYHGKRVLVGNWVDVTKVKNLENKLRESEIFYRSLIENTLTPVYIVRNNRVIYINKAFEVLSQYSKSEILGLEPSIFIHPSDLKKLGEYGETYNFRIVRKDGDIRWVTAKFSKILFQGKEADACIMIDTTEIHRLNEELMRKSEYLGLLNRILRHDIMNDLAVIKAALELREEELLDKALSRVEHMVQILDEVGILEDIGVTKLRVMDLSELVSSVSKVFERDAEIHLHLDNVYVKANESLKSVLQNIIQNAIFHSGKKPVRIDIRVFKESSIGVIEIADNGVGIPDELKSKIFDESFSTRGGTGLGLYIVKKILEVLGGSIEVGDNYPTGAIFKIKLPLAKD